MEDSTMFKVGDRVFILRGSHQNETGVITATDSWSGALTVDVEGWPGSYNISPEACIRVVPRDPESNLSDGAPSWTH
jgi:hypothetical protein